MLEEQAATVLTEDRPEDTTIPPAETEGAEAEPAGAQDAGTPNPGENETEEQAQQKKRLGGWQRKIQKLEQENETLMRVIREKVPAKADEAKPANDDEPKLPDPENFAGTMAELKKALADFPAQHQKWLEGKRQAEERQQSTGKALGELNDRLAQMPELEAMRTAIRDAKVPVRLMNLVTIEAAKKPNGHEVLREALLDAETRDELLSLDREGDAQGIVTLLHTVSYGLRLAAKKAAPATTAAAETKAPKPPSTVTKAGGKQTADVYDDSLSAEDWLKARSAQLKGK